jgi:hypothetical protein
MQLHTSITNGHCLEVACLLDHPAKEQTPWGKAVSKKAEAGSLGFLQLKILKVEEQFGRSAIEGHRTRPVGSDLR